MCVGLVMHVKYLLAAAAVLSLSMSLAAPARADFVLTFDESGGCSYTSATIGSGTCASQFIADPSANPLTTAKVLVFTLPELTWSGNVNIFEPDGVTISDRLRWIPSLTPPNNSSSACIQAPGVAACALYMIFYSVDELSGLTAGATQSSAIEKADGTFDYKVGGAGTNEYLGFSPVPLPAALPLFATGLGASGLLGWRRKRKTAV